MLGWGLFQDNKAKCFSPNLTSVLPVSSGSFLKKQNHRSADVPGLQEKRVLDSLKKTSVLHIRWGVKQCVHQRAPLGVNRCPTKKKVFIATRLTNIMNLSLKCGAVSKASSSRLVFTSISLTATLPPRGD